MQTDTEYGRDHVTAFPPRSRDSDETEIDFDRYRARSLYLGWIQRSGAITGHVPSPKGKGCVAECLADDDHGKRHDRGSEREFTAPGRLLAGDGSGTPKA